jgi:hypothetical protein
MTSKRPEPYARNRSPREFDIRIQALTGHYGGSTGILPVHEAFGHQGFGLRVS